MDTEILFVGDNIAGNFALDFCDRKGYHLSYTGSFTRIQNIVNLVLDQNYQVVIVNIEMFIDEPSIIADTLSRIEKANNAKYIIFAPGYDTNASIIVSLIKKDFKNFIFAIGRGGQIDQFEKSLNGFYDANGMDEILPVIEEVESEAALPQKSSYKTIGIAGSLTRIGTTTQAIQIVKYLTLSGYKACYIQMNSHPFIDSISTWYSDCQTNPDIGLVQYMNVDLYKKDKINEILKMGYDYYVKDYGVYASNDFENLSFLEQDINIIVAGAKPEEINEITNFLHSSYYNDAYYIFSHIPETDQKDILEMMEEKSSFTFFSNYTPDPFVYSSQSDGIYQKLLKVESRLDSHVKKKRFSFFRKNGKNNAEKKQVQKCPGT